MSAKRRGFTLIELLTVIAIIAVLAAILFPVFQRARESARKATCLSNMQQIGTAMELYSNDYNGFIVPWCVTHAGVAPYNPPADPIKNVPDPSVTTWDTSIGDYLRNSDLLICKSNPNPNGRTARAYAIAQYTQKVYSGGEAFGCYKDDIPAPTRTVVLFEKGNNLPGSWGDALGQNVYQFHDDPLQPDKMYHFGGKNFLYVDGHGKWFKAGQGPFANKPTSGDDEGTCEDYGRPADGGDWPLPE
jgi:prepilin-type N-terminal cleavage/methylation domain-containing protein/prepilin-type processing-associated H-X9-DG protein